MPYEATLVSVEKSQTQIKALLKRLNVGATRFTSFPAYALLEFVRTDLDSKRLIPYKLLVKPQIDHDARSAVRELERAERQVWRVVYWWLKAKVEAIEFGLLEFEREFLPHMVLQDGQGKASTVSEIFFQSMAGRLSASDDPFKGLRPALPERTGNGP